MSASLHAEIPSPGADTPLRADTPPRSRHTPQSRHPPQSRHTPWSRHTPRSRHTPQEQTPPHSRYPTSRHPPEQTPSLPEQTPPGADTPRSRHPPRERRLLLRTVHILLECILVYCFIKLLEYLNKSTMSPNFITLVNSFHCLKLDLQDSFLTIVTLGLESNFGERSLHF